MSLQSIRLDEACDRTINSYGDRGRRLNLMSTQTMSRDAVEDADSCVVLIGSDNVPYDKESESDSESESALGGFKQGGH